MDKYDDIINSPHHVSKTRERMSMEARAAQFSPFAALTGYDDEIDEAARLTEEQMDISFDDEKRERLDKTIIYLEKHAKENVAITVDYFVHDKKKTGGEYVKLKGIFRRIDTSEGMLCFTDGHKIFLNDIYNIRVND